MASEDLLSPPFPGDGTSVAAMYNYFCELRKWVVHYRDSLNSYAGQEIIPEVILLPRISIYTSQPIPVMWSHFMTMRRVREEWDMLIRIYEAAWDCPPCLRSQVMLVQTAAIIINNAFTPNELREMREQQDMHRMQRGFERLTAHFKK